MDPKFTIQTDSALSPQGFLALRQRYPCTPFFGVFRLHLLEYSLLPTPALLWQVRAGGHTLCVLASVQAGNASE